MGLFTMTSKNLFSTKFDNAEITDDDGELHFIEIKFPVGNRFFTEIKGQAYCFKIDGSRVKTFRTNPKIAKSFRVFHYDTSHFKPVSAKNNKELEDLITLNSLPKINGMLHGILEQLSQKEKKMPKKSGFTGHDLVQFVESFTEQEQQAFPEQYQNLVTFVNNLPSKEIVTPVTKIAEYIRDDLIETDAAFYGNLQAQIKRTEETHRIVMNKPKTAKSKLLLYIMAIVVVVCVIAIVGLMTTSGAIKMPSLGFPSGTSQTGVQCYDDPCLMKQFPSAESMKAAVDSHTLDYSKLSAMSKNFVDSAKTPVLATPPGGH